MAKHKFPKVGEWSEKAFNASALGFNLLRDFEPEMHRVYPDTQVYSFGYFSEEDLNNQQTIGWKFLEGGMFDVEDFNSVVGSRFGVRLDVHDRVMHGDNYIMLMPKAHREEVILPARKALSKKMEAAAEDDAIVVHPEDPEFNRMKDAGRQIAKTEKYKVQGKGDPQGGSGDVEAAAEEW